MRIVVHGGAGKIPEESKTECQKTLDQAAEVGLKQDEPLDAVVEAVKVLEEHPLFNAGYGGSLQLDGEVRLDAAVMRDDLSAGGVINIEKVKHPIVVAERVMDDTPHVLLQCRGATEFAESYNLTTDEELKSSRSLEKWEDLVEEVDSLQYRDKIARLTELMEGHDTVGAVVQDKDKLAAGTSTGGVSTQMFGRVGDSSIIGSGLYCNQYGAVSTTGLGEAIIKVNLARELIYYLRQGESPQTSAEKSIDRLAELTNSQAGVIAIDNTGNVGSYYNTRDTQTAVRSD